jgi:glutathione peroxidase
LYFKKKGYGMKIGLVKIIVGFIVLAALIISLPYALKFHSRLSIYDFLVNDARGEEVKLEKYKGNVLLIVNTATECGLTPQFLALQKIYDTYSDRGFLVLGFPSNSFKQEPRTGDKLLTYCNDNFLVDFPIFERIDIKGPFQAPLYKFLTEEDTSKYPGIIRWNFEKFLVGRDGNILARFAPEITPDDPEIIQAIEQALSE